MRTCTLLEQTQSLDEKGARNGGGPVRGGAGRSGGVLDSDVGGRWRAPAVRQDAKVEQHLLDEVAPKPRLASQQQHAQHIARRI